jgi:hypothetical protein
MNEPFSDDMIRQIAILIDNLEREAADDLLDQFTAEQQQEVRNALVELSEIPVEERDALSRSFLKELTAEDECPASVEGEEELAEPNCVEDRAVVVPGGPLAELIAGIPTERLGEILRRVAADSGFGRDRYAVGSSGSVHCILTGSPAIGCPYSYCRTAVCPTPRDRRVG